MSRAIAHSGLGLRGRRQIEPAPRDCCRLAALLPACSQTRQRAWPLADEVVVVLAHCGASWLGIQRRRLRWTVVHRRTRPARRPRGPTRRRHRLDSPLECHRRHLPGLGTQSCLASLGRRGRRGGRGHGCCTGLLRSAGHPPVRIDPFVSLSSLVPSFGSRVT